MSAQLEAVKTMRFALRIFLLSQTVGFVVLAFNSDHVPRFSTTVWGTLAAIAVLASFVLAVLMTREALLGWTTAILTAALIRAWVYGAEGLWAPLGAWWIVVSLACSTTVAFVMLFELETRAGGRRKTDSETLN